MKVEYYGIEQGSWGERLPIKNVRCPNATIENTVLRFISIDQNEFLFSHILDSDQRHFVRFCVGNDV